VRASLLVATALGLLVIGSAWLKTRHLTGLVRRTAWQTADFVVTRPAFDRAALDAGVWDVAEGTTPEPTLTPAAREEFLGAMEAYQRGDDARALRGLQHVLRTHPRWAPARFYRGACELLTGHPMAASADLRAARDGGFAPPDGPCDWWLGVAYFYNGDQDAGRDCMVAVAASGSPQAEQAQAILRQLDARRQ
jgi:hypothetical protein